MALDSLAAMSKRTPKLLLAAAIATLSYGAWSVMSGSDDDAVDADAAELMVNHVWVDRMPNDERDLIRFFVPIRHSQGRVGVAGRASNWRQLTDLFLWSLEEDRLALFFGQERVRWKARAKAWRCDAKGFELCLKIWDDRRELLLYSRDEWEIDPDAETAPEALVHDAPQLANAVDDALAAPAGTADALTLDASDALPEFAQ